MLDNGKIVAHGTAEQLKRRVPGGHIRLTFADTNTLDIAAQALGPATRDEEALALQVPSDGSVKSLRAVLDRLDERVRRGHRT